VPQGQHFGLERDARPRPGAQGQEERDKHRYHRAEAYPSSANINCRNENGLFSRDSLLDEAHIKVSSLVSDLLGASALRMLQALADGETNPATLAGLASRRLRATPDQQCDALGACTDLHPAYRRLLKLVLEKLRVIEDHIAQLDQEMAGLLSPVPVFGHYARFWRCLHTRYFEQMMPVGEYRCSTQVETLGHSNGRNEYATDGASGTLMLTAQRIVCSDASLSLAEAVCT
jgi:hypothetical protein